MDRDTYVGLSFTVTGTGRFPLDMLRFEGAYPATTEDAQIIADSLTGEGQRGRRHVRLYATVRPWIRPNESRWASFGWKVSKEEHHDL